MRETNWAGNHVFQPLSIHRPRRLSDAQELIASATHIRAAGTRHSFNGIADGVEMISLSDLEDAVETRIDLNEQAMTVTVPAGCAYGAVAGALTARGYALHNLGSLPHITVGGAISTGTHGSGDRNGVLATAVTAIEFIGPDGELRLIGAGDATFAGSVVALGALGVMNRVTLRIEPIYEITQRVYSELRWDEFLDRIDTVTGAAYSVSVLGYWAPVELDLLWLKVRTGQPDVGLGDPRLEVVPVAETSAIREESRGGNVTPLDAAGPWSQNLPHFRFDREPSAGGDEIQSEYFVDRSQAREALLAVRRLADRIDPLLLASEFRTAAADELWLSPAYHRDVFGIHFTWVKDAAAVLDVLPAIEHALAPFHARPHWGKLATRPANAFALYPKAADFVELAKTIDPGGKFWNEYLGRSFGRPRIH